MMERRQIVRLARQGAAAALVTLVRAEGSSYRRPGARLLIADGGNYAGTISGGCLEAEVVRKASWRIRDGAAVERYSTLFDDTAEIPFGLGCGGTVDLLLEPAATPECRALLAAMAASLDGIPSTVVTWLPSATKPLQRLILAPDRTVLFASDALPPRRLACAPGLEPGHGYEGRFVERLLPPERLFVLGAGDDAKPLVSMAALMGWSVIVADARPQLARAARFPEADRVLSPELLDIHTTDAVVLMTHSYEQDRALLVRTLPIGPRYLGLLGARHRSSLLLAEAAALLDWPVQACCDRVYAPVGLDLGGDGPEAIALSILTEAQASATGRFPLSRRLSADDVAAQIAHGGASRYLRTQCAP